MWALHSFDHTGTGNLWPRLRGHSAPACCISVTEACQLPNRADGTSIAGCPAMGLSAHMSGLFLPAYAVLSAQGGEQSCALVAEWRAPT